MALTVVVISALVGLVVAEPLALKDPASVLSQRTVTLGLDLYHTLLKDASLKTENMVASSLGVMTLGAKDSTASQVKSLLSADLHEDTLHPAFSELLGEVTNETTWKMGSRVYASARLSQQFVEKSKKHYRHDHSEIDFRDKSKALESINQWASENTAGRVTEVTRNLPGADGAMFVNAVYFKPHWGEAFHHAMVDKRGFLISKRQSVSVPMMHRTVFYKYYEDEANQLQVVEMPLGLKQTSMLIIMPFHVEPLDRLEKMLSKEQLSAWSTCMQEKAVAVSLPRVTVDVSHELQKHLKELGLAEAVDKTKADFSGFTGRRDLHLSAFLHTAALELDTEGNPFDEQIYGRQELKSPNLFYADHPFIFLVQDKKSGSILLIGRIVKPSGDGNHDEL
ncbi:serpin H1-like [Amia ocellicauda]|uniref:serpin H1-like n=1 Tax=Amia ocellicauda TaxID=2972642 RepID=UPI0034647D7F|nr:SERPH protein [Amia calva]